MVAQSHPMVRSSLHMGAQSYRKEFPFLCHQQSHQHTQDSRGVKFIQMKMFMYMKMYIHILEMTKTLPTELSKNEFPTIKFIMTALTYICISHFILHFEEWCPCPCPPSINIFFLSLFSSFKGSIRCPDRLQGVNTKSTRMVIFFLLYMHIYLVFRHQNCDWIHSDEGYIYRIILLCMNNDNNICIMIISKTMKQKWVTAFAVFRFRGSLTIIYAYCLYNNMMIYKIIEFVWFVANHYYYFILYNSIWRITIIMKRLYINCDVYINTTSHNGTLWPISWNNLKAFWFLFSCLYSRPFRPFCHAP